MEKRLIDAYDHMTMPEDCTRRIEARLQTELQNRKPGRYTKVSAPQPYRRGSWRIAAAGLLLTLMAGGTLLWYWMIRPVVGVSDSLAAEEPIPTEVQPEREYYEGFTDFLLKVLPDGKYAFVSYAGEKENIEIPAGRGQNPVTEIGVGESVIRNGDKVKVVIVPETVRIIRKNAFADCPALEAVYFEGDAPPEADAVFEGSETVMVYYRKGTAGWGDTWCGRKTGEYDRGHITLGTVTVQDRVPAAFCDNNAEQVIQENCATLWGENVQAKAFAMVDMDRDGVCEMVLAPQAEYAASRSYLVLKADGMEIHGYTLLAGDLRKDGTFYSHTVKGIARLEFREKLAHIVESADTSQQEKPLAQWHRYPCQGFGMVLESYRYATETGISTNPGYGYQYFKSLSYGDMANDWPQIQYWLSRELVCIEDGDMVYAYDSDAPGCVFYGTLIGDGEQRKFTAIGYYICDETEEYRAEVWELDQPDPIYTVEVPSGERGREVDTVEEMMSYLGHEPYYDIVSRDVQQIAQLLDSFVHYYSIHDMAGVRALMAPTVESVSSYPFSNDVAILSYGILPDAAVKTGESWHTSVELLETGAPDVQYCLSVALVKQADGWKIQSYSIEKQ